MMETTHSPEVAESLLRAQLASIEVYWRQDAAPILAQLATLEAMRPPRPVWMQKNEWAMMKPDVHAQLWPGVEMEQPGARMSRLEDDRRALLHLVRLMRCAIDGGAAVPAWLNTQIETALRSMKP